MKWTFGLFDMGIKDHCLSLINQRVNFSVKLIRDDKGDPHHWLIEEIDNA